MDAPRLPAPPLRRRPARGALAVSRAVRRVVRLGSRLPPPAPVPTATPINLVDVIRGLASRPALLAGVGAIALAVTLHLVVGGASMSIRPAKRATVSTTSVAVESTPEVLAEDIPAVPPPTTTPPPPPPPPAPSQNQPAAANAAPSTSPAAAAVPPGLQPTSFAAGGSGTGGGGFGAGGGQALPSSTPQAKATVSPTVTPARAVSRPPPRYPPAARRDGLTGVVTLAIQVGEQGSILAVRVVDSDPVRVFDAAALESVRAWRFEPATRDGVPVTTWVRQTIRFTLEAS